MVWDKIRTKKKYGNILDAKFEKGVTVIKKSGNLSFQETKSIKIKLLNNSVVGV